MFFRIYIRSITVYTVWIIHSFLNFQIICQDVILSTSYSCSDICQVNERRSEATCEGIGLATISELSRCTDYEILNLRYNSFKHLEENSFSGFHNLIRVDLSSNHISGIDAGAFSDAFSLQIIHLIGVKVHTLKNFTFRGLENLEELLLVAGKLEAIEEFALSGLSSLKEVDFSYNKVASLPEDLFRDTSNLEIISISHNKLQILPEDLFQGLENLKLVELIGNKLITISGNLFASLPSLEEVNLSKNKLTSVPAISAQRLDLSHNNIVEIHHLPSNISWRTLHLRGNRLHCDIAIEPLREWYACQRNEDCEGDANVDTWVCATPIKYETLEVHKLPSLTTTPQMTTTVARVLGGIRNIPEQRTDTDWSQLPTENSSSLNLMNILSLVVNLLICYATI